MMPRISNFFNFFANNFKELGLKKLIASCYQEQKIDYLIQKKLKNGYFFEYTGKEGETTSPNSNDIIYFKKEMAIFAVLKALNY